jgi:hypothetical protein
MVVLRSFTVLIPIFIIISHLIFIVTKLFYTIYKIFYPNAIATATANPSVAPADDGVELIQFVPLYTSD